MLALMVMWQNSVTRRTGASLLFMLSAAYVMALLSAVNSFRVPQARSDSQLQLFPAAARRLSQRRMCADSLCAVPFAL